MNSEEGYSHTPTFMHVHYILWEMMSHVLVLLVIYNTHMCKGGKMIDWAVVVVIGINIPIIKSVV